MRNKCSGHFISQATQNALVFLAFLAADPIFRLTEVDRVVTFKSQPPLTFLLHAHTSTWFSFLIILSTANNSSSINRSVSRVQARSDITLKSRFLLQKASGTCLP